MKYKNLPFPPKNPSSERAQRNKHNEVSSRVLTRCYCGRGDPATTFAVASGMEAAALPSLSVGREMTCFSSEVLKTRVA